MAGEALGLLALAVTLVAVHNGRNGVAQHAATSAAR
jgi:hypothetical protein